MYQLALDLANWKYMFNNKKKKEIIIKIYVTYMSIALSWWLRG